MPTDHAPDPAGLGPPDVEDLLDLWEWVCRYRGAAVERERVIVAVEAETRSAADPHLADWLDRLARLTADERARLDDALERYLGRSDPPWALWERAFGWRPGRRQVRAFLHRAVPEGIDVFPLRGRDEQRRYAIGGAVEHVYRYLDNRQSEHLAIAWTQVAAALHGVPGAEVGNTEPADPDDPDREPDPAPDRGAWATSFHRVLRYDSVRACLGDGNDRPVRRGPKIAACKAVSSMVGPSWRACEDAHKEAIALMPSWRSTAR